MAIYDVPPRDYKDPQEWFLYFRVTKSLPYVPRKFEQQMERVQTAQEARTVMTAYAATAFDILNYIPPEDSRMLLRELEKTFELKPHSLLELSVDDMSAMINHIARWQPTDETLADRLQKAGFKIDQGVIKDYQPMPENPPKPAPKQRFRPGNPGF